MKCWIYRGSLGDETYLYLAAEDDTKRVPDELLQRLGQLQLVMELMLSPLSTLARANPLEVMRSLRERGFYLQMPPVRTPEAEKIQ